MFYIPMKSKATESLTLSLLMSYLRVNGAPSKARNLTSIYGRDFYLGFCFLNRAFR
jgi:hypothetical protein